MDGSTIRIIGAAAIACVAGVIVYLFTGAVDAAVVTLAAALAAAALTTFGGTPDIDQAQEDFTTDAALPVSRQHLIDAIVEPVLLIRDGRVILANQAALRLLGQHIVGEDARTAIRHPAAADHLADTATDALQPIELVGLGTLDQRWQMRATAIEGGIRVVHLIDQTGHYAAEKMRVDFVANASHELRTPLASILGYVETLTDEAGEDPALRQRFLGVVFDEARRMERLVEDLMSLSRIEAEKFRPPRTEVDLAAVAREVRDSLLTTHGNRGADIAMDIADDLPRVPGDQGQLSQLLYNLIGNAMKYGRAGTPIKVTLTRSAQAITLTVADEGDGISPEHLPRLTERFYRVDAGRSRALGGTGLGLAIVKHIAERHRARLDISSAVGVGTRVSVVFRADPGVIKT